MLMALLLTVAFSSYLSIGMILFCEGILLHEFVYRLKSFINEESSNGIKISLIH